MQRLEISSGCLCPIVWVSPALARSTFFDYTDSSGKVKPTWPVSASIYFETTDDDALIRIKNSRTGQNKVVSSIEVIHRCNPSRKLNRCIKITTKQMRVCYDSELRAASPKYQLDLEIAKKSNFSKLTQNEALRPLVTKILFQAR